MIQYLRKLFSRRSLENPNVPLSSPWLGSPTLAGVTVNEETALRYSTVWACVLRLSSDIASLKFSVCEHLSEGGRVEAPNHPIHRLIHRSPDGIRPAYKFWQTAASHVLRWGNAYVEIEFSNSGEPLRLNLLPPQCVTPRVDRDPISYEVRIPQQPSRVLPAFKILHFAGMGYDGIQGYSPITMARESIGLGLSADLTMASYFGLSSKPSGTLQHPGKLSEQAAKQLRENWEILTSGPTNAGRPAVLQEGMTWNPLSLPAPDQAFLQSRQWQPEEICRWYLMPPPKAGIYDHATFSNLEQANLDYLSTIIPWANSFTGEMNHKLFQGADADRFYVRPNYHELMKADKVSRAAFYASGRQWGWLSADDCRDAEDMNDLPNGEGKYFLSPANMWTSTQVAQQSQQPIPTPSTSDPSSNDAINKAVEEQKKDKESLKAFRAVVEENVGRMLRRETAAIRRAAKKEGFVEWLPEFYAEHRDFMASNLESSLRAYSLISGTQVSASKLADSWVGDSRKELVQLVSAIHSSELASTVDDLCERWESGRSCKTLLG
jgi:HK97 family phage portal protein